MDHHEDTIVDISKQLERFFSCSGKMLKPSIATVEGLICKIPRNELITTDLLRKELAEQFNVQVTCPYDTKKALQAIANDSTKKVPFWRVIKTNGELIAYFPGGRMGHTILLSEEGFTVDTTGKVPRVRNFSGSLVQF